VMSTDPSCEPTFNRDEDAPKVPSVVAGIARWMTHAVMALLLLAGLMKAADPVTFSATVEAWETIPVFLRTPIVVGLPAAEVLVAGCWFLRIRPCRSRLAALSMLLAFFTATAVESAHAEPGACGCFGLMDAWLERTAGREALLYRTGVMTLCLLTGLLLDRGVCKDANP